MYAVRRCPKRRYAEHDCQWNVRQPLQQFRIPSSARFCFKNKHIKTLACANKLRMLIGGMVQLFGWQDSYS